MERGIEGIIENKSVNKKKSYIDPLCWLGWLGGIGFESQAIYNSFNKIHALSPAIAGLALIGVGTIHYNTMKRKEAGDNPDKFYYIAPSLFALALTPSLFIQGSQFISAGIITGCACSLYNTYKDSKNRINKNANKTN